MVPRQVLYAYGQYQVGITVVSMVAEKLTFTGYFDEDFGKSVADSDSKSGLYGMKLNSQFLLIEKVL